MFHIIQSLCDICLSCISTESNADSKRLSQTPGVTTKDDDSSAYNDEEAHAQTEEEKAVVDESAGADRTDLVPADVIQLLDAILERIEE